MSTTTSALRGKCLKAARTFVRPTTGAATVLLRVTRCRSNTSASHIGFTPHHQNWEPLTSDTSNQRKSGLDDDAVNRRNILLGSTALAAASALGAAAPMELAQAQQPSATGRPPNILVIMGDDVGWFNIGAYHQGIMAGKTPNLDKLASEGMRFTDYYAEASCTAGRANFITELTRQKIATPRGGRWHGRTVARLLDRLHLR